MFQTTINNLMTKARIAMLENDYKKATAIFEAITELTCAIERGEKETDSHGIYLLHYVKQF